MSEFPRPVDGAWRVWERLRGWDQRFAIAVDAALAGALFIVCAGWFVFSTVSPADLWFVAGLTLPLIFRRRAPVVVFIAVAIVALVQWLTTGPLVADSALLAALFTVTAECDWMAVVVAGLILEIGVILATERWTPVGNYLRSLIFLTGMASAALLAGIVVRELRSQMEWLAERAHRLEVERDQQAFLTAAAERARIAREMHDVVSHNLQVMVTLADAAAVAQRTDPARATEAMAEVSGTGRQALQDMRRLLGLLRDEADKKESENHRGVSPDPGPFTPQPGLGELGTLTKRVCSTGLAVEVESSGEPFALSGAAELTVYRIVQEALTNALKHAVGARAVQILLSYREPDVTVRVIDDGQFSAPALFPSDAVAGPDGHVGGCGAGYEGEHGAGVGRDGTHGTGHGILGMVERAASFNGSLNAGPRAEGGWQVTATLRRCKAPALL
jgi:signal transduction histidine kinase